MAAPVKRGVQGGDSMENEAERPRFDLWLPPVPLWLLSGHPERSSPPAAPAGAFRSATARRAALSAEMRRNSPDPARKRQTLPPQAVKFPDPGAEGAKIPLISQALQFFSKGHPCFHTQPEPLKGIKAADKRQIFSLLLSQGGLQKGEVEFRLPVPGLVFQVGLDIMVIEPIHAFGHDNTANHIFL